MMDICLMLQDYLASRARQRVPAALAVEDKAASADPFAYLPSLLVNHELNASCFLGLIYIRAPNDTACNHPIIERRH